MTTNEVTPVVSDAINAAFRMLIQENVEAVTLLDFLETRTDQLRGIGVGGYSAANDPFIVEILRRIDCLFPSLLEEAKGVEVLIEPTEDQHA